MIFTDIVGFSSTAAQLTAEELLDWVGYTFNVMDLVAEYYKVYKVKNVGDMFFGMAGLPGLVSEDEPDEHTLRVVKFASSCVQIFSGLFLFICLSHIYYKFDSCCSFFK